MNGRHLSIAANSFSTFLGMASANRLHLKTSRVGHLYKIDSQSFAIFRETVCDGVNGEPVVLVVGFRLHAIRSSRVLHWCFQRLCILTTPFWSGLKGFRVKLWMVDPRTKDYLGIYDWRGEDNAQRYLDYLLPILRFFSVKGTVWHIKINDFELEKYLDELQ